MALNVDLVGKEYSPQTYEVGREKIREFADAVGDTNAAYHDVDAARALGNSDLVAPPTFAVVVTRGPQIAVIDDPELGLDFTRVVHGDQKFRFTRPIVAGDVLATTSSVSSARTVAGNDILTIRSDVADTSGVPVVSVFATLVARAVES
ncbi:MAG TPA: MaoC family dehydratase N-terminal domain-containing protein [Actinomycetes bacterium]|nr:MaoC family dehydratase N-terminal domain-containing protein [Actinomycetes bacterium]